MKFKINETTLINILGISFAIFVIGFMIWALSYTFAQPFIEETTTTEVEVTDTTDVEITTTEAIVETTTKKPIEVTTTVVTTEPPKVTFFNIPLDERLQDYMFELCANYDVEPEVVIAIIKKESNFKAGSVGDRGRSLGLMQIQPRWHQARMIRLGCPKTCFDADKYEDVKAYLLDPYNNVTVGTDFLAELFNTGNSLEWVLMAYNGGPSYADKKVAAGELSEYARIVLGYMNSFKKERV